MKENFKRIIPDVIYKNIRYIVRYFRLLRTYYYDFWRYFCYSMNVPDNARPKLIRRIILDTHVIEKGLTMPETRPLFGIPRLKIIIDNINIYLDGDITDFDIQVIHAIDVLNEYVFLHKNVLKIDLQEDLLECIALLNSKIESNNTRSDNLKIVSKSTLWDGSEDAFYSIASKRKSLRNFSDRPVEKDILRQAISLSTTAPSACNRQSVRFHLYAEKTQIQHILSIQGGNRGFGHLGQFVIAITFEASNYFEQNERNLGYVDGGIAAMNLLYSLHHFKLAACILNASHDSDKDIKMRKYTKIPKSENFVSFIVGGHPCEEFKVALSKRYDSSDILTEH